MDPCKYCGDHFCCRQMCNQKKAYLDYIEGESKTYRVKNSVARKKLIVSLNKNGIRKEEYR